MLNRGERKHERRGFSAKANPQVETLKNLLDDQANSTEKENLTFGKNISICKLMVS